MKLVYMGQFRDLSGYAIAARDYLKALDIYLRDHPDAFELRLYSCVAAEDIQMDESERKLIEKYEFKNDEDLDKFIADDFDLLWHLPPPLVNFGDERFKPSPGCSPSMSKLLLSCNKSVSLLAWETDTVPTEWKRAFEYYPPDKIITPSRWNKDVFEKGMQVPCDVVPHVISDKGKDYEVAPMKLPIDMDNKFVILSVSQWTQRKGFDRLLKSFFAELGDEEDALLLLKTYESVTHNTDMIRQEIKHIKHSLFMPGNELISGNNVMLIDSFLPKKYINWLYKKSDVFALFTRGEGFGLPIAEALLHETPVVVPQWGGHIDFIHANSGFYVAGHWDTCTLRIPPYGVEGRWFECSIDEGRKRLREAYEMWKNNRKALQEKGRLGRKHILNMGLDYKSIGEKLYKSICNTKRIEKITPPPITYTKDSLKQIKSSMAKEKKIEKKLAHLKDAFKGETCYILNCGPSLRSYDPDYLREKLGDKLVFAVKQSYNYCPEIVDFHFFNCSNLPMPKDGVHYNYSKNDVISVGSSNYPLGVRWDKKQPIDLFMKIPIRTTIKSFLCDEKNFDDYLLENSPDRPCGPGIMYESVIHTAVHLGVSKIVVLGWDLGGNPRNPTEYEHFYDRTEALYNPGDILKDEVEKTRVGIKDMNKWLASKEIDLVIASNISRISLTIPRVRV
jgi:glycosyltransferase involved in cell wall biosynthesis